MTAANTTVFSLLDRYCSSRSDPIKNAGSARWTTGPTPQEKSFLVDAKLVFTLNFTLTRRAGLFEYDEKSYFCLIGFEQAKAFAGLTDVPLTGGIFTTLISELQPKAIASTLAIRNIVEAQDRISAGAAYKGHPLSLMESLFPSAKVFSYQAVSEAEAYRIFFRFCAMECDSGDFWIEPPLVSALIELCDLEAIRVPYQTLCRSIFDADQAALFLGLYRCIEALYALQSARKVARDFNLKTEWTEIVVTLESSLGWRAPEASSLNQLLKHCEEEDLLGVLSAIKSNDPRASQNASDAAGKQIYKLRNALVHYRPIHHKNEYKNVNWNELCTVMTSLVRSIYRKVSTNTEISDELDL